MRSSFRAARGRSTRGVIMLFELYLAGIAAFGLCLYLFYVLVHPEEF